MVVAKVNISKLLVTKLLTDIVFDDSLLKLGRIMPEMRRIVNSAHLREYTKSVGAACRARRHLVLRPPVLRYTPLTCDGNFTRA